MALKEEKEGFVRLGILPPEKRKSASYCLWQGTLRVNLPVLAIICGGYGLLLFILDRVPLPSGNHLSATTNLVIFVPITILILLSPIIAAWIWWSFTISNWRIWALRIVDDWQALESQAIYNLIWPRGSIFERTEIKSAEKRQLEKELTRFRDLYG